MAKTHQEHQDGSASAAYDDGMIVTMRIGGYLGALPYRQYADMGAADLRALNVGRRYLAERAAQSALAKKQKDGGCSDPAAFLRDFLGSWTAPVGDSNEFTTVGSLRADIAKEYLRERFSLGTGVEADATIAKNLPAVMAHPKHSEEISRRLAAKFAEYVAPKKRDEKSSASVDESKIQTLDLDAA